MSEHDPDPAALDELSRAFAADPPGEFEGVRIIPRGEPPEAARPADPTDPDELPDDLEPTAPTPIVDRAPADPDDEPPAWVDPTPDDLPGAGDTPHTPGPAPDSSTPAPNVISIGDDDFPDAHYIEGSLDAGSKRRGGSGVVIIEDDDTGDALKPESERDLRRGIEPRMRDRRIAVRRAAAKKRLVWVGVAVGVIAVVVAVLAVLGSGMFAVSADHVTVTGNVYTDPDRLQDVIDDLVGTPTLLADTTAAEQRLEDIPWVADAKVTVRFPHSASIEIRERQAISTYQGPDQRFRVLDREGRVLDVLDKWPLAYVLIGGPDPVDLEPGQFAPFGYAAASELAKNLTPGVRSQLDRIGVTADGSNLALRLEDGTEVRFGEARDLLNKLVRLETLLDELAEEGGDGGPSAGGPPLVIDVSTRETTRG